MFMRLGASLVMLTALSLSLTACDTTRSSDQPVKEAGALTDTQLEDLVRSRLNSDAQIKAANIDIDADGDTRQVTLSGKVESQEMRTRAVELARSAQPAVVITDKIDVVPREITRAEYTEDQAARERTSAKDYGDRIGNSLDDAWIHMKVVAKLIGDKDTPERKINVDVVNNVVTLRGTIDNATQKSEAERIARETEGVKQVVNQLKVAPMKG